MEPSGIRKKTRDIVGPTGYMVRRSVDAVGEDDGSYLRSFEKRIPPSLFVSERDRTRLNQPMPLAERAIPDVVADPSTKLTEDDYEEAFRVIDAEGSGDDIDRGSDPPS